MSMYVNKYELYPYDEFVFSQRCTGYNGTEYHLMKDQIESSQVSYSEEYDSFLVKSILKDGMEFNLVITNICSGDNKPDDRIEIDVYAVKDFLDKVRDGDNGYCCVMASVADVYGFYTSLIPDHIFIDTSAEDELKLYINGDRMLSNTLTKVNKNLDVETVMYLVCHAFCEKNCDVQATILNFLYANNKDAFLNCFVKNKQK